MDSVECASPDAANNVLNHKLAIQTNDNPGIFTSPAIGRPDDKCCPLVYREREEIPKLDSDGHLSSGDDDESDKTRRRRRRSRQSLPLRYASHSSRDSSPASDTTQPTKHDQISATKPKVRLSSVLAKRHRDDFGGPPEDDLDFKRQKEELLQSQRGNRQVFDRNKRMFGMLIGTLKKFKTEETSREEVTLRRSKIDEKLELNESPTTGSAGDSKSVIIDKAEMELDITGRFKNWESSHKHLAGFIQTDTRPKIFWLPNEHNLETEKRLKSTRDYYNLFMAERAAKCKKETDDLEKASLQSLLEAEQRSRESPIRSPHRRRSRDYRSPANDTSGGSSNYFRRRSPLHTSK